MGLKEGEEEEDESTFIFQSTLFSFSRSRAARISTMPRCWSTAPWSFQPRYQSTPSRKTFSEWALPSASSCWPLFADSAVSLLSLSSPAAHRQRALFRPRPCCPYRRSSRAVSVEVRRFSAAVREEMLLLRSWRRLEVWLSISARWVSVR